MADVSKIKLPDSSEYNIKDYRIPGVDTTPTSGSDNVVTSGGVYDKINDESLVISTALNDLNNRLLDVENITIPTKVSDLENDSGFTSNTGTLTGVSFNGVDATVSNGVAAITATIPTNNVEIIDVGFLNIYTVNASMPSGTWASVDQAIQDDKLAIIRIHQEEYVYDYICQQAYLEGNSSDNFYFANLNENTSFYLDHNDSINLSSYSLFVPGYSDAANITASDITNWNSKTSVTESTVSGWGFTKNTGTYSMPSGGIPATDLASAVQTSLGKADTALQSFTEADPVFSASAAAGITSSDITNWNTKGNAKIFYGTSTSSQSVAYKLVDCSKFTSNDFVDGTILIVKFSLGNTSNSPGISILNHSCDIKKMQNGQLVDITRYDIVAGTTMILRYDQYNDYWRLIASDIREELPTVTSSDNDKVLTVVSGKWAAATASSGAGTLDTTATTAQTASASEALSGSVILHKVAKTGTYSDLIGTPTIPTVPTNVSSFTNDANYVKYVLCNDEAAYNAISNKDSGTLYLIPVT